MANAISFNIKIKFNINKAFVDDNGNIRTFRIDANMRRMKNSVLSQSLPVIKLIFFFFIGYIYRTIKSKTVYTRNFINDIK
jgi:hypothetical protein